MSIDIVAFIFGAILLSTGLWGGGLSIRDISIPKIGTIPRAASIGMGIFIILMGIGLSEVSPVDTSEESTPTEDSTTDATESTEGPDPPTPAPTPISNPPTPEPTSASATDPDQAFRAQVGQQLVAVSEQAGLNGFDLTHEPYLGQLADNTQEPITLDLRGGVSYGIIGVCDSDCGDMDLELYDENGNLIDSDTETDAMPIVEVTPQWDGPFTINVIMPNCAAPYCYYGLGAFGQ
ncbi:hypothetical protein XM38_021460 [Halomicronema hongdechloris C2206]|uniref:Uncharacterized protein n=1 Tax=Halomicronema hongdechloris C2206 TaxID=1641165 RepID=A0A1Z3HLL7_9CYAN|nr:hypothetical protein [Halomicronema hongdechloris]ASC71194.1 hypothetical protein XM38_021460 [Halomicronema hongdechloris C2206]